MTRRAGALVSVLTAAGLVIRLTVFVLVLVLLALFTRLNILALALAFIILYTILSGLSVQRHLARMKKERISAEAGREGGVVGG